MHSLSLIISANFLLIFALPISVASNCARQNFQGTLKKWQMEESNHQINDLQTYKVINNLKKTFSFRLIYKIAKANSTINKIKSPILGFSCIRHANFLDYV